MTPKKYFMIANVLLITAGVYLGVNAVYTISRGWLSPVAAPQTHPGKKMVIDRQADHPPLARYAAITKRNLFNTRPDTAEAPAQTINLDNLKETDLKLKLWGTVTGEGRKAYAVIEDTKTREQNLYRVGDTIQDATLKLILRQKVVLSVNDRDEVLGMEEAGTAKGSASGPRVARKAASPPKLPVTPNSRRQLTLQSDQIENALQNIDQLMEQARIRPHIEDGKPSGISITGIKPNTVFRKMRLRNGDIITGVNGTPIESVEDAMQIFGDLSSAPEVQLEIKRRGRKRVLNYKIE
ncbi:MAG: type II secretion system protein GspC [Deltaproteobacteria bacterium]|jgi:general secretion pathway protein C